MISLRPHKQFNFVKYWKVGFIISAILIVLSLAGLITSAVTTGSALQLGTEFSGGTSIQIANANGATEDGIRDSFNEVATEQDVDMVITSVQTANDDGFIIKTTDTDSAQVNNLVDSVVASLELNPEDVEVETIGASWGSTVVNSSILAFILSIVGIILIIAIRYKDIAMGVTASITLLHDMLIIIGVYAWCGIFFGLEITSDTIAALLAIVGYSLYDTVVVYHRLNKNAKSSMSMSLKTCANKSMNEVIVRSINTSITSVLPVFILLILGTATLFNFAVAMCVGIIIGCYSTIFISLPIYTLWKSRDKKYKKLESKYGYEVIQSPFTTEMMRAARKNAA